MQGFFFDDLSTVEDIDLLRGRQSFHYVLNNETIALLKKNLHLPDSLYLIVRKGDDFAAFCSMDRDWWEDGYFFIREILVDPKYLQMGLGKELFKRCIDHAKACKAVGIVTETDVENTPMKNLCSSFGFAEWKNPQWDEGVTYKLMLE